MFTFAVRRAASVAALRCRLHGLIKSRHQSEFLFITAVFLKLGSTVPLPQTHVGITVYKTNQNIHRVRESSGNLGVNKRDSSMARGFGLYRNILGLSPSHDERPLRQ